MGLRTVHETATGNMHPGQYLALASLQHPPPPHAALTARAKY